MRVLTEQNIREILIGVTFLAAGGGGSIHDGFEMLESNLKFRDNFEIELITPEEIKKGGSAVMIAGMGAPTVLKQREEKFKYEAGYAVDAMISVAQVAGKRVDAIIPVEYGAVNYIIPMIAAIERGMPLVDADGCGRAVPGLDTTLFNINGIPFCPAVACDDKRNIVTILTNDPADGKTAEKICRTLCGAFDYVMGLGGWLTSPGDINEKLIPGAITLAEKVGKVFYDVQKNGGDLQKKLSEIIELRHIVTGEVVKQDTVMKNAHDIGVTEIKGDDGKSYFVDIKNESILIRCEDEVMLTCPDMLCAVDVTTTTPVSNVDIKVGMRLSYYAVPAPRAWFKTQEVVDLWKPYFEAVGYNGDAVTY